MEQSMAGLLHCIGAPGCGLDPGQVITPSPCKYPMGTYALVEPWGRLIEIFLVSLYQGGEASGSLRSWTLPVSPFPWVGEALGHLLPLGVPPWECPYLGHRVP
jgi:hypothetical protein